jgi:DNA-binding CsgD family transcriptional regulator
MADGRAALDLALENGWWPMAPWIAGFLAEALVEHDDLDEAEAVVGLPQLAPWLGPAAGLDPLLESRARLRAERADHRAALTDFRRVGELRLSMEADNPAISAWRSGAAQALAALGEAEEAAELAAEELLRARAYGAEGAIGVALRALGLITGGSEGVELLQEAVATLERADARLEHARALVDLGASLRRAGRRVDARAPLREGLDQARRCGGLALARRAHDELTASGAKPRRMLVGGVAALTPSERRVAELAVEGMTNAQIAQALFVTQKTVETHLGRTYRKLDIAGREALATALADD